MRLQVVKELRDKIQKQIDAQNKKLKSSGNHVMVYNKRMLDNAEELKLLKTSRSILNENHIPKDLDLPDKGQVLLFML
jgi:hypothetical protein